MAVPAAFTSEYLLKRAAAIAALRLSGGFCNASAAVTVGIVSWQTDRLLAGLAFSERKRSAFLSEPKP
jgi:hypothetical protein